MNFLPILVLIAFSLSKKLFYFCRLFYRYATEVDVDFVRKAVRAIGRCAIKVEQSAERCVSTLLDLIQTKVKKKKKKIIIKLSKYWEN